MEKITYKKIKQYRKMESRQWHDQVWHNFMVTKEAEAIGYALDHKEPYSTDKDIKREAESYLKATADQRGGH
jgi:hypothetical protein